MKHNRNTKTLPRKYRPHWIRLFIASLFVVGFVVVGAIVINPSHAASEICSNSGSGYCLDDWNNGGSGNLLRVFNSGSANEGFTVVPIPLCNNSNTTTPTCPLNSKVGNYNFSGVETVEIKYSNGLCVGTGISPENWTDALLTSCGTAANHFADAGYGVVMIKYGSMLESKYWTSRFGIGEFMCAGPRSRSVVQSAVDAGDAFGNNACLWGGLQ